MLIMLVGRSLNDVVLTTGVWYLSMMVVSSFGENGKRSWAYSVLRQSRLGCGMT